MGALITSARPRAEGTRGLILRLIASVVAILLYGWINFILNPVSTLLSAEMAGKQFQNSDASYVASSIGMNFFSHFGVPFIVLLAVLVAIWWRPANAVPRRPTATLSVARAREPAPIW